MKKIILFTIICLALTGCVSKEKADFNYTNEEQIEKEVLTNLDKISEVVDALSSNPYDYTKNEYYENIVDLGKSAVPVLESMYKDNKISGINAYLSALAIEDITDCHLYEKYNLKWETAEEFYNLWKDNNCSFKK